MNGECTRGSRMCGTLAALLNDFRELRRRDLGQMQRSDFLRSKHESVLPFLINEQWPECIARQMQRILITWSVIDLDRCDDELVAGLAAPFGKEADAADNEARARNKARVRTPQPRRTRGSRSLRTCR